MKVIYPCVAIYYVNKIRIKFRISIFQLCDYTERDLGIKFSYNMQIKFWKSQVLFEKYYEFDRKKLAKKIENQ